MTHARTHSSRARSSAASAADFLPDKRSLASLRAAAQECRGCDLYRRATQTVFGQGLRNAELMLVGEVPGDEEDRRGKPFVGPAGRFLRQLLAEAGAQPNQLFLTNAVKHFKWEPRGKRRLHAKPSSREITACRPWLEAEIMAVAPHTIVCLGATAAQSLLGRSFRLTHHLGELFESPWAPWTMATYHPSAALRAPEPSDREQLASQLLSDLKAAVQSLDR